MIRQAIRFMKWTVVILGFTLASVYVIDATIIRATPEPLCQWVATEVRPAAFRVRNGHRFEVPAYEVEVLMCKGGEVVRRR